MLSRAGRASPLTIVLLVLGAAVAAAAPEFPKPTGHVNDIAGAMDEQSRDQLEHLLTQIDEQLGVQLAVAIVPELGGYDASDYANRLFEAWHIGNKQTNRGLLLLDAIAERKVWIEVGYGLEGVLPDGRVGAIRDQYLVPLLKQNRRDLAYAATARALIRPILEDAGQSPDALDSLLARDGYKVSRRDGRGRRGIPLPIVFLLIIIFMGLFRPRRRRQFGGIGGMPWGGFGGFGSFGGGGGGGGGFSGFGGGSSGGGGAGGSY